MKQMNEEITQGIFQSTWLLVNYTGKDDDKTKRRHYEFMYDRFLKALSAKDLRYQEMVGKLEKVREALIESRKCMDSDHTLSNNYGRAWNLGNNALTLLSEIMKDA